MKDTLKNSRFVRLLINDLKNSLSSFGLTWLIIVLLPLAVWLFCLVFDIKSFSPTLRVSLVYICTLLTTIMAPSRIYKNCNIPDLGIYFAMLPASKKEKFWSMFVVSAVVVPLATVCASLLLDFFLTVLPFGHYRNSIFDGFTYCKTKTDVVQFVSLSTAIFFSYASVFFFTTTLFKKHKVTKTFLWALFISFIVGILSPLLFAILSSLEVDVHFEFYSSIYGVWWYVLGLSIWSILFYWAAYYRLKRMQY